MRFGSGGVQQGQTARSPGPSPSGRYEKVDISMNKSLCVVFLLVSVVVSGSLLPADFQVELSTAVPPQQALRWVPYLSKEGHYLAEFPCTAAVVRRVYSGIESVSAVAVDKEHGSAFAVTYATWTRPAGGRLDFDALLRRLKEGLTTGREAALGPIKRRWPVRLSGIDGEELLYGGTADHRPTILRVFLVRRQDELEMVQLLYRPADGVLGKLSRFQFFESVELE